MRSQNEASPIHAKRTNRRHSRQRITIFRRSRCPNNNLPDHVHEQPQQVIPEQSNFEELHADHGMIYYERQNIESDQNISIPESQAETQEPQPDNASMNNSDTNNSEHQTNDRPPAPSRHTMSRYVLRHNPKPTTYPDFLMHELHGTPSLQQLLLKNRNL